MTKYEKFEEWMVGKRVVHNSFPDDEGVVVGVDYLSRDFVIVDYQKRGGSISLISNLTFLETQDCEQESVPWEAGQVVWDILYGKGVVRGVKGGTFPIKVEFEDGGHASYTFQGSFYESGPRSLFFSEPKIIAETMPPKKPFTPKLKKGDKIVMSDRVADYVTEVVNEDEYDLYYKTEDGVVTFVRKDCVRVFKLGEEIVFD